jgi:FtsP/CotA-like multicopper oxidase with cupredoxin domain
MNRIRRAPALLSVVAGGLGLLSLVSAKGAVPGITGTSFNLVAADAYTIQPDGATLYSWGYGCDTTYAPVFAPSGTSGVCPQMQTPGPTLIITEGQSVTVTLTNKLPAVAGNTSILFPGLNVTAARAATQPATCGARDSAPAGLLTTEVVHGCSVTYTITAPTPGTYSYYSGTQSELQIEMGMFGAVIVLPATTNNVPVTCKKGDYSLAPAAYNNPGACYDREYLFQFSEMDARVHQAVDDQVHTAGALGSGSLNVSMDPYQPQYFLVNGRSMPDDMDAPYSISYQHQPYNGNPHMHPGDLVLMRIIGQGRIQHPFHYHGNHSRVLARDGNLLLGIDGTSLAGPLLFTTPTVPGQTQDQIFSWTGQGLNWDVYGRTNGHSCNGVTVTAAISNLANSPHATPTATDLVLAGKGGGYISPFDATTKEWCPDHGKDIPVAPPDPQAVANGLWYGGTPYLGMQSSNPTPLPPGAVIQNANAGYAYMWHSHNEREITTNNVFPGGLMMMLIIDPPTSTIDETK